MSSPTEDSNVDINAPAIELKKLEMRRSEVATEASDYINATMEASATAGSPDPDHSPAPVAHPASSPAIMRSPYNAVTGQDSRNEITSMVSGITGSTSPEAPGAIPAPRKLDAALVTGLANPSTPSANRGVVVKIQATPKESVNKYSGPSGQTSEATSAKTTGEDKMPSLEEFLQTNEELKLWLNTTNYFDLEHREKVLFAYKKLATIEEEKKKLMEEIQNSRPIFTVPACSHGPVAGNKEDPTFKRNDDDEPGWKTKTKNIKTNNREYQAKAKRSSDRDRSRSPGSRSLSGRYDNRRVRDYDDRSYEYRRHDRLLSTDDFSHRLHFSPDSSHPPFEFGPSHQRSHSTFIPPQPLPPPERLPERLLSKPLAERITYSRDGDSHNRHESRNRPHGPPRPHRKLDLGRNGETRFFIVKSYNARNVRACMEDGIWTTQLENGAMLTHAFNTCKNVILFFSVNMSKAFQGYARMATAPGPGVPHPTWMRGIHWPTTDPFRVEWLTKHEVEFWRVGHLTNALNGGQPVLVRRDGQEVEEDCGRSLLRVMDSFNVDRLGG